MSKKTKIQRAMRAIHATQVQPEPTTREALIARAQGASTPKAKK